MSDLISSKALGDPKMLARHSHRFAQKLAAITLVKFPPPLCLSISICFRQITLLPFCIRYTAGPLGDYGGQKIILIYRQHKGFSKQKSEFPSLHTLMIYWGGRIWSVLLVFTGQQELCILDSQVSFAKTLFQSRQVHLGQGFPLPVLPASGLLHPGACLK